MTTVVEPVHREAARDQAAVLTAALVMATSHLTDDELAARAPATAPGRLGNRGPGSGRRRVGPLRGEVAPTLGVRCLTAPAPRRRPAAAPDALRAVAQPRAIAVQETGGRTMVSTPSASAALVFADGVTRFCSVSVFFA